MLNDIIGCLMPGRLTEIQGDQSSGKTMLALQLIKHVQDNGGIVLYIDVDHKLSREALAQHVDMYNIIICEPKNIKDIIDCIKPLTESKMIDLIVIDSVGTLTGDKGTSQEVARFLMELSAIVSKNKCACLVMNQYRFFKGTLVAMYSKIMQMYCSFRLRTSMGIGSDIINIEVIRKKLDAKCIDTTISANWRI